MKKVIKVKLDPKSIENAITELRMYKEDLERRVNLLVDTLTKRGAEVARAKVVEMGAYYTGELLQSIDSYLFSFGGAPVGFIRVNAEYGLFVEFGTGIVGENSKHHPAESAFGWEYDVNDHGEVGWLFPTDDGTYRRTRGQASRPFMYETALQLRDEFPAIVREVFG